jgi:predicted GH43/DUF377 family glycosyl hydrolase
MAESVFKWNYNSAVVPYGNSSSFGILVRCQNQANPTDPYSVTPSKLALANLTGPWNPDNISLTYITLNSVVFEPDGPQEEYGTEDPRVVYREKTGDYYLLYSAVQANPVVSRLALATTKTPGVKSSWVRHGPLFPNESWSKSGAMLIRDGFPGPHYLFYGDSSLYPGLQIATSTDLLTWTIQPNLLLEKRASYFDSTLVEAGPMPLPLSDGNYLFIYNSARPGYPSKKPNWNLQYNVGWVILDKNDPTKILLRSDKPLFSPVLSWEKGDAPQLGLTPNVVFLEGWIAYQPNKFIVVYGAADSVVGVGIITVTIS